MDNFNPDLIKKIFPFVDRATDSSGLITCIVLYLLGAIIGGILIGFVPIIGWILGPILELWFIIGIVLSVLTYLRANGGGSNNGGEQ
ncbi:MAG: hypothetical protein K6F11_01645 [Lachnospiraceae bacterium]|jgi:hypothetical protein|nr:hypothetical protein [Lachnospiraceae bacterium]